MEFEILEERLHGKNKKELLVKKGVVFNEIIKEPSMSRTCDGIFHILFAAFNLGCG
jgi:hypothetical protein